MFYIFYANVTIQVIIVFIIILQQVIPPEVQLSMSQPAVIPPYYNPSAPTQIQPSIPPVPLHHNQQPPPHVLNAQPLVATVNGAIHPEDINVMPGTEILFCFLWNFQFDLYYRSFSYMLDIDKLYHFVFCI